MRKLNSKNIHYEYPIQPNPHHHHRETPAEVGKSQGRVGEDSEGAERQAR
jgi:hypothetical protein